jgi:thiol-disulfide isomerase/thioredoxin
VETFLLISVVLLWIVVIAQLILFLVFSKLVVRFLNGFRLVGRKVEPVRLQRGERAPFFREKDQWGLWHTQTDVQDRATLLLFVNNTCGTCRMLLKQLQDFHGWEQECRLLVVASSPLDEDKKLPPSIPLLLSAQMFEAYRIDSVPMAVAYGPDERLLEVTKVEKFEQFEQLAFLLSRDHSKAG